MEAFGTAANVLTVIELSTRVASLCLQYSRAVKDARASIESLREELKTLAITLEGAQRLLNGPNGSRLQTSQRLRNRFDSCRTQLEELEENLKRTLNVGRRQNAMSRVGLRALKWPFESKDVNDIIVTLKDHRDELTVALSIDHLYVTAHCLGYLS